jgi:hypothetical protein
MAADSTDSTSKKGKFLRALTEGYSVTGAAKIARVDRTTVYVWRKDDDDFKAAWDEAIEAGGDLLEDEAWKRATKGTLKPIYQGGKKVGSVREYSDTLLIFLLKGRKPEKYRERINLDLDKEITDLLALLAGNGEGSAS